MYYHLLMSSAKNQSSQAWENAPQRTLCTVSLAQMADFTHESMHKDVSDPLTV